MFQQFDPSVRSTLDRVAYAFVDWQYNTWILDFCNGIVKEGSIPEDWKSSVVLPIYKGKGYHLESGSYIGIKLLEHAMKMVERIFEHRIRPQIEIDDMQLGFMKGKGTTDGKTAAGEF